MKITGKINEVREAVREWKMQGYSVGLVPTMGYLHDGHKSLIVRAAAENDRVVVSDFVNPMQFGPSEDLAAYPRDLDHDAGVCEDAGADLIFHPDPSEMYSEDFSTFVDMDTLTGGLCGKTRPTHFRGACTVVSKLFNIVTPDRAYFGQKDAQQLAVVRHMAADLNFGIEIVGCPIVREADGLAKSSRNIYLSPDERKAALVLSRALSAAEEIIEDNDSINASDVERAVLKTIESEPLAKTDYVEIVSWPALERVSEIEGPVLCALAIYIGKTRLIDNIIKEK